MTIQNTAAAGDNKKVIFKNCALFTNCISEINHTQVDDAHDIDVVMLKYNLIEYGNSNLKTSGCLWQYHINESTLNGTNNNILCLLLTMIVFCLNLKKN